MSQTKNWIAMGYIKGAFGVKGWVKVQPNTEYADSLLAYPIWHLVKGDHHLDAQIAQSTLSGDELHIKFAHIHDRDSACLLRGYTVYIDRQDFAEPEEDEFYWADLIGMNVYNRDNILLGQVSKLLETGAHDVLVINGEFGEKMIPFVAQFIEQVEAHNHTIRVDWGIDY